MYPEEVIRYLSGNYNKKDKKVVDEWIEEDPARKEELKRLRLLWDTTRDLDLDIDVDEDWNSLEREVQERQIRPFYPLINEKVYSKSRQVSITSVVIKAAAVLLLIAGVYGFFQFYSSNQVNQQEQQELVYQTLSSEEGELVKFRFNDGSKVVLNGNSQLRYRQDFGANNREMELVGEAYFEVNHDHPSPFIVHANGIEVKDIGTKFNISAYPHNPGSEVVVSEGLVEVTTATPSDKTGKPGSVMLAQGQKAKHNSKSGELVVGKADLNSSLAWLETSLIFDEIPFREVVHRLERHYEVKITVKDKELLSKKIIASFNNESLENVLKLLSLSLNANYTIENKSITVTKGLSSN